LKSGALFDIAGISNENMNFDEWYRQSPTRLRGPTAEDIEEVRMADKWALTG
jgi:hypothetical protein